jgi:signal transduction histidine kinase
MRWTTVARWAFLVVVAVLFVSGQAQVWSRSDDHDPVAALAVVLVTAPLVRAHRRPLTALVVVLAGAVLEYRVEAGLGQVFFAVLLAVYALGSRAVPRASGIGMTLVALAILSVDLPRLQDGAAIDEVVPAWFIVAGTWGLGRWMQQRRVEHAELVSHNAALERDREEAAHAAAAYERARIARELHDLVAHSMAVIVLQAQAGQRVLPADVQAAARSLAAIESMGREGMTELRRLLDVLLVHGDEADESGRPSLSRLDDLVAQVRAAGLDVTVEVDGEPGPLPPGLDLSAYRIIQEALTNALKHGARAPARVRVGYGTEMLSLTVTNPVPTSTRREADRVGHGLIGMRERAALYGGAVEAGDRADGEFRVHATLPLAVR